MKAKKLSFLVLITVLYLLPLHADYGGSFWALFFNRHPSSRAEAMGRGFVTIDSDMDAYFYNPAGINGIDFMELKFTTSGPVYIAKKAKFYQFGLGYNWKDDFVIGLNLNHFTYGEKVHITNVMGELIGEYTPYLSNYTLTLATSLSDNLLVGANINYSVETELRKNLWILDSLNQRKHYSILKKASTIDPNNKLNIPELLEHDEIEINTLNSLISNNVLFQNYEKKIQKKILSNSNWKFDRNKPESRYSWRELYQNTNMTELLCNDMYKHFSSHIHSSLISLAQSDQLDNDSVFNNIKLAIEWLNIAYAFMIKDYSKKYEIIKKHLNELNEQKIKLINVYYKMGKNEV